MVMLADSGYKRIGVVTDVLQLLKLSEEVDAITTHPLKTLLTKDKIIINESSFHFFNINMPNNLIGQQFDASIIIGEPTHDDIYQFLALYTRSGKAPITLKII